MLAFVVVKLNLHSKCCILGFLQQQTNFPDYEGDLTLYHTELTSLLLVHSYSRNDGEVLVVKILHQLQVVVTKRHKKSIDKKYAINLF